MLRPIRRGILAILLSCLSAGAEPLEFRPGDKIVFVGATFVERAQRYGHIETALHLAAGSEAEGLRFRNLGWSGDSVFGDARSYFGPPQEGRERLQKALSEAAPQILLACYGAAEAMSSGQGWTSDPAATEASRSGEEASLALFIEGYGALLDLMQEGAGEGLREIALIAPPPLENLGPPLPDQTENNRRLARTRDAILELAERRGHRFVDLFAAMGGDAFDGGLSPSPLTDNGLHYGDAGYRAIASHLVEALGLALPEGLVGAEASVEAMRQAVARKNRLFFHRWRPANETYLFLFRKHEQGQNAAEIPMFDPLIAAEEEVVEQWRARVFAELTRP